MGSIDYFNPLFILELPLCRPETLMRQEHFETHSVSTVHKTQKMVRQADALGVSGSKKEKLYQ